MFGLPWPPGVHPGEDDRGKVTLVHVLALTREQVLLEEEEEEEGEEWAPSCQLVGRS